MTSAAPAAPRRDALGVLMPGFVGVYQINLKVFEGLPDNPRTPLTIAQRQFVSNTVTIPVKPLQPKDPE